MLRRLPIVETESEKYRITHPSIDSSFARVIGSKSEGNGHKFLDLEYRISSLNSTNGERRYRLNLEPYIAGEVRPHTVEHMAGILAEQVMRIRTKELMRRIGTYEGIIQGDFVKGNWAEGEVIESDEYVGRFLGRHNIELYKKNKRTGRIEDNAEAVSELDGLFLYERENGSKGLIVTESKIGNIGHYSCTTPKNKGLVTRRIISPMKSLFPNYDHAVLLATPHEQTITGARRLVKKRFYDLKNHLDEKESQLILLPFNETANDFRDIVKTAHFLREHYKPDEIIRTAQYENDLTLVTKNSHTRFVLQNNRILEILEKRGKAWHIVYES